MAKNLDIIVDVKSTNNLKEMKKELKDLKSEMLGLKEGSAEFQRAQARAGELQDTIGDLNDRVKVFASDTKKLDAVVGVTKNIAAGFQIATGAAALLGGESKQLEQAMQKIVIVQGMLNAVNEISNYIKGQGIVQDKIRLAITNLQTQATINQTATQKALNLVMKANPVFILIGAFVALTGAYLAFSKGSSAAERAQVKLNEAMVEGDNAAAKEEASLKILVMTINSNVSSLADKKDAIKQLNEIAPEYLGNITLENIGTRESISAIQDYIKMVRTKAEIQALEAQLQESISARLTLMRHKEAGTLEDLGFKELIRLGTLAEEENQILSMIQTRQMNIDSISRESEMTAKGRDKDREDRKEAHDEKVEEYKYEISAADQARLDLAEIEVLKAKTVEERAIAETNLLKLQHEIQIKDKSLTNSKILLMETELELKILELRKSYMTAEEQAIWAELDFKRRTYVADYEFQKNLEEQKKKDDEENRKKREENRKKESEEAEQDYEDWKKEQKEIQEKKKFIADQSIILAQATSDTISEIMKRSNERELQEIKDYESSQSEVLKSQLANREITQKEYDNSMEEMNQQVRMKELQEKRKAFRQQKAMTLADIAIKLAATIMGIQMNAAANPTNAVTFGAAGISQAAILSAVAIATAGVQAGLVASQKFTAARGGIVPGSGPSNIDSVPSLLAPGEAVINANSTKMFGSLLSQINEMGGGISLTPDVGVSNSSIYRSNGPQVVEAFMVEKNATELQRQVARYKNRGKIK